MGHRTFHCLEGAIQGHILAYGNEKVVEGCGRSAAITGDDAANVGQDVPK